MELRIDFSHMMAANIGAEHGLTEAELASLEPALERAHRALLADAPDGQHRVLGFMDLPTASQALAPRLLEDAQRFAGLADAHVVLGIGGSYLGARMLFESLGHRYHNELSPAKRGGWPRIYFEGNGLDNDSLVDLFDRLEDKPVTAHVVSKSGGTLETAVAFRLLRAHAGRKLRGLAVTTEEGSALENFCTNPRRRDIPRDLVRYFVPKNVGGRYSVLTPVGLFPAALMGIDIAGLLRGAAQMQSLCAQPSWRDNPAALYASLQYLSLLRGHNISVMSVWDKALEAFGLWYDQLSAESLGKEGRGRTPFTAVCTRELHSRGQQHQEGTRDKVVCNLVVDQPRRAPLSIAEEAGDAEARALAAAGTKPTAKQAADSDGLFFTVGKPVPTLNDAAYKGTDCAYAKVQRPGLTMHLDRLDAEMIGGLIYLFELATVLEGHLMAINPLDQPGVEAYKGFLGGLLDKPGGARARAEFEALQAARVSFALGFKPAI